MKIEVLLGHMSNIADALEMLQTVRQFNDFDEDEEEQQAGDNILRRADKSFKVIYDFINDWVEYEKQIQQLQAAGNSFDSATQIDVLKSKEGDE